jgi:hypothetical protein
MKQTSLRVALGACALVALVTGTSASAQVSFNGSYSQNFDGMLSGTTAPSGWTEYGETGSNQDFAPANAAVPGVSPDFTDGALTAHTTLTVGTPTTQKGSGGYNFDASGLTGIAGDRALGTSASGVAATFLQLAMTNNTGSAISAVTLSYDIDRFTTTVDNHGYSTTASNYGVEEYPGYQLFYNLTPGNNSDWVNVSSLNPTIDAGTTGPVQVPNSIGITSITPTSITLSGNWAAGATIDFAWLDDDAESPSPDQLLGLNNVSILAAPEPGSGVLGLIAAGAVFVLLRLRRQRA